MTSELQDKVQMSIERIKAFEPKEGYFLAYSGGKDDSKGFWKDAESVMKWWTGGFEKVIKGQMTIDDYLE